MKAVRFYCCKMHPKSLTQNFWGVLLLKTDRFLFIFSQEPR